MIFFVYQLAEMMLMTVLILNLGQIMKEAFQGGMLSLCLSFLRLPVAW